MKKILSIVLIFVLAAAAIIVVPFVVKKEHIHLKPTGGIEVVSSSSSQSNTPVEAQPTLSGSLQRLVMPGPLSKAHAAYEEDCAVCHAPFSQTSQKALCLTCHQDIQKDMETVRGLHGHAVQIKQGDCKTCHTEHKGRDFAVVLWDKAAFRHDQTGYKLSGAHANAKITCDQCHAADKKYRAAPTDCFSCHQKDDYHHGQLGRDCASCHQEKAWQDAHYDHDKTKFPLTGKHKQVGCAQCHVNAQYKGTPVSCLSCHYVNDVHADPKKTSCDKCHTTKGWREDVTFDHAKETRFPLKNGHAKALCEDCHKNLIFTTVKSARCVDCHQTDDVHHGHNGAKCESCHNDTLWKNVTFDHDRNTQFKLLGKHKEAQCDDCHKRDRPGQKLGMTCFSCHQADDVHKESLGRNCETCHNERGWNTDVVFDHDLTKFPLVGLHATASCGACHLTRDFKGVKSTCVDCHKQDDFHRQTLGTNCSQCHTPNGWRSWRFDHNKTRFPLDGAHDGLSCAKCHATPAIAAKLAPTPTGCFDCHEKQNKHGTTYGTVYKQCGLCHVTQSFRAINRAKIEKFHNAPDDRNIALEENCASCHHKDDIHGGGYGNACGQCHSVDSWKNLSRIER